MRLDLLDGYDEAIEEIRMYSDVSEETLNKIVNYINIAMEFYKGKLSDGEWLTVLYESVEQATYTKYKQEGPNIVESKHISAQEAVQLSLERAFRNSLNLDIQAKKM